MRGKVKSGILQFAQKGCPALLGAWQRSLWRQPGAQKRSRVAQQYAPSVAALDGFEHLARLGAALLAVSGEPALGVRLYGGQGSPLVAAKRGSSCRWGEALAQLVGREQGEAGLALHDGDDVAGQPDEGKGVGDEVVQAQALALRLGQAAGQAQEFSGELLGESRAAADAPSLPWVRRCQTATSSLRATAVMALASPMRRARR